MMRARAKILEGTFLSPNFVYFNLCIIRKTRLLMIFLSNSSFKNFGGTKWDSSSWERLLGNKGCWRSPYSPVASPRTEMGALTPAGGGHWLGTIWVWVEVQVWYHFWWYGHWYHWNRVCRGRRWDFGTVSGGIDRWCNGPRLWLRLLRSSLMLGWLRKRRKWSFWMVFALNGCRYEIRNLWVFSWVSFLGQ